MKWNVSELRNEINEINWMNQTRQWNGINEREGRPPKDNATKTNHSLRLGMESQQRIGVVVAAGMEFFSLSSLFQFVDYGLVGQPMLRKERESRREERV